MQITMVIKMVKFSKESHLNYIKPTTPNVAPLFDDVNVMVIDGNTCCILIKLKWHFIRAPTVNKSLQRVYWLIEAVDDGYFQRQTNPQK